MRILALSKKPLSMLALLLVATSAWTDRSDLMSQGTGTIGGVATISAASAGTPILLDRLQSSDWGWNVLLTGGYFVIDNLEIDALVSTGGTFATPTLATVGVGAGARYYFDLGDVIYPYIGVLPSFNYNSANSLWYFRLPASAGFLVGLNCAVALDVGVTTAFSWAFNPRPPGSCGCPASFGSGSNGTGFDFLAGYIGVKAFF